MNIKISMVVAAAVLSTALHSSAANAALIFIPQNQEGHKSLPAVCGVPDLKRPIRMLSMRFVRLESRHESGVSADRRYYREWWGDGVLMFDGGYKPKKSMWDPDTTQLPAIPLEKKLAEVLPANAVVLCLQFDAEGGRGTVRVLYQLATGSK